ncbi:MAG: single-stranded DNA-binding protein [Planctomycetes bacterium DG_58]|nr:MAG: single-stranded DNA-binding protein [Planctomycetes bacterium DG_58]KPK96894.1 MAG: single-stranded DNA-binding protein [Planctomycetes bacterium SM23_65]
MANLNKVMLIGNLTRDPELRYLQSGTAVCDFGLAVNRNYTKADGEKVEETTFVDITAFGRQAEVVSEFLQKGRPVFIEGRLRLDQWTAQDGQKRSKLRVVMLNFQFLDSRRGGGAQGGRPQQPRQQQQQPSASDDFDTGDDSIPF